MAKHCLLRVLVPVSAAAICLLNSSLGVPPAGAETAVSTLAQIAAYNGPDRTARLVAGAKQEGEVDVYTSETVDDVAALSAAFQKKYGLRLNLWRGSANDILQRAVVEARGGRFAVDAIETGAITMESLQREQLLQRVDSPAFADLKPEAIRPHHEWIGTRYNVFVAAYNTAALNKKDLPKSYADLTNPKWKDKLGIEAESSDWFGTLTDALGGERGVALFHDIVAANGISVRRGHTLLANLVVSGEVPLAISTYLYKVAQLKARGAPIDWFTIPPVVARFEGVGVARRAPHPYAAMLYLDFMLTDAQAILAKRDFLPASTKIALSPAAALPPGTALTFIDPAKALDQNPKWSTSYRQIVMNQPP
jgi:ABC-type Fe3+ transport system substrate-binding protein